VFPEMTVRETTGPYVLETGRMVMHGASAELANNKQVQAAYLGSGSALGPTRPSGRVT